VVEEQIFHRYFTSTNVPPKGMDLCRSIGSLV